MTVRRGAAVVVAALAVTALGALLGVLWESLAPRVVLIVADDGNAYPQGYQPEGYAAADGIAALLCVGAGLVVGLAIVWVMRRAVPGDDSLVAALVVGVLLGAIGATALWWTGARLGHVDIDAVIAASTSGDEVTAPVRLRMPGVLVLWPTASVLVVFIAALGDWWRGRVSARRARV